MIKPNHEEIVEGARSSDEVEESSHKTCQRPIDTAPEAGIPEGCPFRGPAADGEPVECFCPSELKGDLPFPIGCCEGSVRAYDSFYDPSPEPMTPYTISRYEARILARHWAGKFEDNHRWRAATGEAGGYELRIQDYAVLSVRELVARGALSKEDLDRIWDEPYAEHKDFWDAFKAAGCVNGFMIQYYEELKDDTELAAANPDPKPPGADMSAGSSAAPPPHRSDGPGLPF